MEQARHLRGGCIDTQYPPAPVPHAAKHSSLIFYRDVFFGGRVGRSWSKWLLRLRLSRRLWRQWRLMSRNQTNFFVCGRLSRTHNDEVRSANEPHWGCKYTCAKWWLLCELQMLRLSEVFYVFAVKWHRPISIFMQIFSFDYNQHGGRPLHTFLLSNYHQQISWCQSKYIRRSSE